MLNVCICSRVTSKTGTSTPGSKQPTSSSQYEPAATGLAGNTRASSLLHCWAEYPRGCRILIKNGSLTRRKQLKMPLPSSACIYIHVYNYLRMYTCIYVCTCMGTCICTCVCTSTHVYDICIRVYINIYHKRTYT